MASQCRGLILRQDSWDVVAYPFNRFFNYGSGHCAEIDWTTAKFEEKADGSLAIISWDENQNRWWMATRKRPQANTETLLDGQYTFESLTDEAAQAHGKKNLQDLMSSARKDCTYMFELTSPVNEVVVKYATTSFTLLGVRDLNTFQELDPIPIAAELGVPTPKLWSFNSIAEMIELVNAHHPHEHEGIVVKDANFNRIKVKNLKHHLANASSDTIGRSWRSTAEVVMAGQADDLLDIVPAFVKDRLVKMRIGIDKLINLTMVDYKELEGIDVMKDFAMEAKKRAWPSALFALKRKNVATLEEFLTGAQAKSIVELVGQVAPELGIVPAKDEE